MPGREVGGEDGRHQPVGLGVRLLDGVLERAMATIGAIGPKVSCVTAIESGGTSSSTVGSQ